LGGYQNAQPSNDDQIITCPVTRTSMRDNNVIGNCGVGIGEPVLAGVEGPSIPLWTYFFDDNDYNNAGHLRAANDLPTGAGECNQPDPAVAPIDAITEYSPPFDWPIVPQVCGEYD